MNCINMIPINYGDTWKVAREKINSIMDEVEANIPSIWENNDWYLWPTDTWVPATWPQGEEWPQGEKWDKGDKGEDWQVVSQKEYDDTPWTSSDDVTYMIRE